MTKKEKKLLRDFYQKLVEPEREMVEQILELPKEKRSLYVATLVLDGLDINPAIKSILLEAAPMTKEDLAALAAEELRSGLLILLGKALSFIKGKLGV